MNYNNNSNTYNSSIRPMDIELSVIKQQNKIFRIVGINNNDVRHMDIEPSIIKQQNNNFKIVGINNNDIRPMDIDIN